MIGAVALFSEVSLRQLFTPRLIAFMTMLLPSLSLSAEIQDCLYVTNIAQPVSHHELSVLYQAQGETPFFVLENSHAYRCDPCLDSARLGGSGDNPLLDGSGDGARLDGTGDGVRLGGGSGDNPLLDGSGDGARLDGAGDNPRLEGMTFPLVCEIRHDETPRILNPRNLDLGFFDGSVLINY